MQIYSDSVLIFLNMVNDIAIFWRNFVTKLIFTSSSICYCLKKLNHVWKSSIMSDSIFFSLLLAGSKEKATARATPGR